MGEKQGERQGTCTLATAPGGVTLESHLAVSYQVQLSPALLSSRSVPGYTPMEGVHVCTRTCVQMGTEIPFLTASDGNSRNVRPQEGGQTHGGQARNEIPLAAERSTRLVDTDASHQPDVG